MIFSCAERPMNYKSKLETLCFHDIALPFLTWSKFLGVGGKSFIAETKLESTFGSVDPADIHSCSLGKNAFIHWWGRRSWCHFLMPFVSLLIKDLPKNKVLVVLMGKEAINAVVLLSGSSPSVTIQYGEHQISWSTLLWERLWLQSWWCISNSLFFRGESLALAS